MELFSFIQVGFVSLYKITITKFTGLSEYVNVNLWVYNYFNNNLFLVRVQY
jgi:hypothetical protein